MKSSKRKTPPQPLRKKRYQTPSLIVHGDIRRLTQAKGGALGDGGGMPKTRMMTIGG
jgi:hypothetical protein